MAKRPEISDDLLFLAGQCNLDAFKVFQEMSDDVPAYSAEDTSHYLRGVSNAAPEFSKLLDIKNGYPLEARRHGLTAIINSLAIVDDLIRRRNSNFFPDVTVTDFKLHNIENVDVFDYECNPILGEDQKPLTFNLLEETLSHAAVHALEMGDYEPQDEPTLPGSGLVVREYYKLNS